MFHKAFDAAGDKVVNDELFDLFESENRLLNSA